MKKLLGLLALLGLSACDVPWNDATCNCFTADGEASGKCDFDPVPVDPAVFTLSTKSEPC